MKDWLAPFALGLAVSGIAILLYALYSWARLSWTHRRQVRRSVALAAGIRDERLSLMVDDPTDLEAVMDAVRDAEPLEVDGPVVPRYVDRYASRDLIPYGRSKVHAGCMLARADAASDHICALCAVEFVRSVIA